MDEKDKRQLEIYVKELLEKYSKNISLEVKMLQENLDFKLVIIATSKLNGDEYKVGRSFDINPFRNNKIDIFKEIDNITFMLFDEIKTELVDQVFGAVPFGIRHEAYKVVQNEKE